MAGTFQRLLKRKSRSHALQISELEKQQLTDTEKRASYSCELGTTLFALRHSKGVVSAADSRCVLPFFGIVKSDNDVKHFNVWENIYVSHCGPAYLNVGILEQVSRKCISAKPTSTFEVAQKIVEERRKVRGKDSVFLVTGRLYSETQSKIFKVHACKATKQGNPNPNKKVKTGSETHDDQVMYDWVADEAEYALSGLGEPDILSFFDPSSYVAAGSDEENAKSIIRQAMSAARDSDYCTDGPVKAMSIEDQPPKKPKKDGGRGGKSRGRGGVKVFQANPVSQDPASGYGEWVGGTFRGEAERFLRPLGKK